MKRTFIEKINTSSGTFKGSELGNLFLSKLDLKNSEEINKRFDISNFLEKINTFLEKNKVIGHRHPKRKQIYELIFLHHNFADWIMEFETVQ